MWIGSVHMDGVWDRCMDGPFVCDRGIWDWVDCLDIMESQLQIRHVFTRWKVGNGSVAKWHSRSKCR